MFGIDTIPNTDLFRRFDVRCVSKMPFGRSCVYLVLWFRNQYSGLMQSQILTKFGDMLCIVFPKTLYIELIRCCVYKRIKGDIQRLI